MRILSWVLIPLTTLIFTLNRVHAQWIQTSVPEGGPVYKYSVPSGKNLITTAQVYFIFLYNKKPGIYPDSRQIDCCRIESAIYWMVLHP